MSNKLDDTSALAWSTIMTTWTSNFKKSKDKKVSPQTYEAYNQIVTLANQIFTKYSENMSLTESDNAKVARNGLKQAFTNIVKDESVSGNVSAVLQQDLESLRMILQGPNRISSSHKADAAQAEIERLKHELKVAQQELEAERARIVISERERVKQQDTLIRTQSELRGVTEELNELKRQIRTQPIASQGAQGPNTDLRDQVAEMRGQIQALTQMFSNGGLSGSNGISSVQATQPVNRMDYDRKLVLEVPVLEELKDAQVRDFLAAVKSSINAVNEQGRLKFLEAVVLQRIRDNAKTRVGEFEPASLADLETKLWAATTAGESRETLSRKLNEADQGGRPLETFVSYLEGLVAKLTFVTAHERGYDAFGRGIIEKEYRAAALCTFKRGITDPYVKVAVTAAAPKELREALQVALAARATQKDNEVSFVGVHDYGKPGKKPKDFNKNKSSSFRDRSTSSSRRPRSRSGSRTRSESGSSKSSSSAADHSYRDTSKNKSKHGKSKYKRKYDRKDKDVSEKTENTKN